MHTYFRILAYARSIAPLVPLYGIATLLAIAFGLINFSLLIPLLEILFSSVDLNHTLGQACPPAFYLNLAYFKDLFQYYFVHVIATQGRVIALYFVCVFIIISVLLTNLCRYLAEIVVAEARTRVVYNLRTALFDKTVQLHVGYFTDKHKGDIIARIINDIQEVEHAVVDTLRVFFKEPATILGFFAVMYYISARLTCITLLCLPFMATIVTEIVRRLRKNAAHTQASLGKLVNILEETLGNMLIVKAFTATPYILSKFEHESTHYAQHTLSMELKKSLAPPISEFLGVTMVALILAYGGQLVLTQQMDLAASTFITYIIIFSQALVPMKSICKALSNIQRGLAAGKRIFTLMDTQPTIVDQPGAVQLTTFQQALAFHNVSFTHNAKLILDNLNLTLHKGQTLAIVGPSGVGKSTIVSLIARFYDATRGVITIDGIPIQRCCAVSLRKLMGIVTQQPMLFNDTIYNNIALGRPEANWEHVIAAASIAHAHTFISELPQGYQTYVGERGAKLSGGQVQRIAIARAVLCNPPILILDEATAALDSACEQAVQAALEKYRQDKTVIMIAHRLSTVQHADEILVIEEGSVVAQGTHEVLLQQSGLYKSLQQIQTAI